jgi:hypothetical protein
MSNQVTAIVGNLLKEKHYGQTRAQVWGDKVSLGWKKHRMGQIKTLGGVKRRWTENGEERKEGWKGGKDRKMERRQKMIKHRRQLHSCRVKTNHSKTEQNWNERDVQITIRGVHLKQRRGRGYMRMKRIILIVFLVFFGFFFLGKK